MLQVTSKYKICKRLGNGVFEKCQTQKFALSEARTAKTKRGRRGGLSDFGKQMIEKQKMRFTYGISEKQFAAYVKKSMEAVQPQAALFQALEMRLDNVAFRLGLASTRRAARQMTSHGHLTVNGKRMNVPSHRVRPGDVISVREGSKGYALFASLTEKEHAPLPAWLSFDYTSLSGLVKTAPLYAAQDAGFDVASVLEFYSR